MVEIETLITEKKLLELPWQPAGLYYVACWYSMLTLLLQSDSSSVAVHSLSLSLSLSLVGPFFWSTGQALYKIVV